MHVLGLILAVALTLVTVMCWLWGFRTAAVLAFLVLASPGFFLLYAYWLAGIDWHLATGVTWVAVAAIIACLPLHRQRQH